MPDKMQQKSCMETFTTDRPREDALQIKINNLEEIRKGFICLINYFLQ